MMNAVLFQICVMQITVQIQLGAILVVDVLLECLVTVTDLPGVLVIFLFLHLFYFILFLFVNICTSLLV